MISTIKWLFLKVYASKFLFKTQNRLMIPYRGITIPAFQFTRLRGTMSSAAKQNLGKKQGVYHMSPGIRYRFDYDSDSFSF